MPELLSRIFDQADRADNIRSAQVCRRWSNLALSTVWRNTDNLAALLSILVPLEYDLNPERHSEEEYYFSRLPTAADWRRFERYAAFVKTLSYRESSRGRAISHDMLMDISKTRTRFEVFPNLHTLEWNLAIAGDRVYSVVPTDVLVFIHAGIRSLSITFRAGVSISDVSQMLGDVPLRSPNLSVLMLRTELVGSSITQLLPRMLRNLPKLETLTLPRAFLTNDVWEALATLPLLGTFRAGFSVSQKNGGPPRYRNDVFSPRNLQDGPLLLRKLMLYCSVDEAVASVRGLPAPDKLLDFHIFSPSPSADSFQSLAATIVALTPGLTRVSLSSESRFRTRASSHVNCHPLTAKIMEPLLSFQALTNLGIHHPRPLALTVAEVGVLCSNLPTLKTLLLNKAPVFYEHSSLSFDVLPMVGRHCRNLRELGLFLDSTTPITNPFALTSDDPLFPRLQILNLGTSMILKESVKDVAFMLAKALPRTCSVECGALWCGQDITTRRSSHLYEEVNARLELWDEVIAMRELLLQAIAYGQTLAMTENAT